MDKEIKKIKSVHFVGIGGIGVSAIAKLLFTNGSNVTGTDVEETFITRELVKMGIQVKYGHSQENIKQETDILIYSPAVPTDNIERVVARGLKIQEMSYPEFLGFLSKIYKTIAVSGTHGKSTTTAMIGLMLEAAGLDPTVIVGSRVPQFKLGNVRVGAGEWLVVEACEYKGNMKEIKPDIAIITSIELDHLDYYKDINHIIFTFNDFTDGIKNSGTLVIYGDSDGCKKIKVKNGISKITFGEQGGNDWQFFDRNSARGVQTFFAKSPGGINYGPWGILIPGKINVLNMLAAVAAANSVGIDSEIAAKALVDFKGIWRRFERLGNMPRIGAHVIADYGHHPTAIKETLVAAREFFPGHRIVLVFQPHQHNRTKNLYKDFIKELSNADLLVGVEIYDVAGREEQTDQDVSMMNMINEIKELKKREGVNNVDSIYYYAEGPNEALEIVKDIAKEDDVIIIMGAGDIWTIGGDLVK